MGMSHDVDAAYMSSPQVARILGITGVGVAQLVRQGKIPAVKIANRWLIPRDFVEEFARTYEGKRGRPRRKGPPSAGPEAAFQLQLPESSTPTDPAGPLAGTAVAPPGEIEEPMAAGRAEAAVPLAEVAAIAESAAVADETPPVAPGEVSETGEPQPEGPAASIATGPIGVAEPQELSEGSPAPGVGPVEASAADADALAGGVEVSAAAGAAEPVEAAPTQPAPVGVTPAQAIAAPDEEAGEREAGAGFKVRAAVYHLDRNYDFEVYEKGRMTDRARVIVARLKPRIPSLPQFSFRWDYRYEHLNVDIHGVEPSVADWWTMGQNGYTGHLPRRLEGKGFAFEAVIWLPVTFVFRGRLSLSLGGGSGERDEAASVASTTGGLRKLWNMWPGKAHS